MNTLRPRSRKHTVAELWFDVPEDNENDAVDAGATGR
jgi:hypothetical protein